ncbi:hypothetical protein GOP47_0011733 [Adiantum capillus-veneris]|uniref:Uncharacterized protein n=1 Tax=Adiantum capillus-veneris TaxID=13818 RepID=A0A9D4ZHY4_ADICA|nr:hypothetical protein GOP47_0011733 [Adiantum capillus-veneris]
MSVQVKNFAAVVDFLGSISTSISFANIFVSRSSSIVGSPLSSMQFSVPEAKLPTLVVCQAQKFGEGSEVSISRGSTLSLVAAAAATIATTVATVSPPHEAYSKSSKCLMRMFSLEVHV